MRAKFPFLVGFGLGFLAGSRTGSGPWESVQRLVGDRFGVDLGGGSSGFPDGPFAPTPVHDEPVPGLTADRVVQVDSEVPFSNN